MDTLIDVLLGLIALAALIAVCLAVRLAYGEGEAVEQSPYREGLDASARMSAMAFEAEHAMHVVAEQMKQGEG